jgi:AGCS family alanine or glycine:cation symporter
MRLFKVLLLPIFLLFSYFGFSQAEDSTKFERAKFEDTTSFAYKIDAAIKPAVKAMGNVLFFDPFAALGIYDPVLRNSDGTPVLDNKGKPVVNEVPFVVVWLILGSIFFTLRFGLINIRGFGHAIALVRGVYDTKNEKGEVSHFQALATALSATVGLGNIAGVAVAISIGGPGATIWMIIAGFLGMASKFTECALGVKYRFISKDGTVFGGPMNYLSQGLAEMNLKTLGKILAVIFAILCVGASFGGGNMFQVNQAFGQISAQFDIPKENGLYVGIVFALLVGIVIVGGIKSIAKVTDKLVPFMVLLYLIMALIVIIFNFNNLPDVFKLIWNGAFNTEAAYGGVLGVMVQGFRRAAFSSEAGIGSASIAHSAVRTKEPVSEGFVGLLEPFIDTVVICTLTAVVISLTGVYTDTSGIEGSELTTRAFSTVIPFASELLTVVIVLFAFSTMISWSYYGEMAWAYLFGKSKKMLRLYQLLFLLFVVLGATIKLGAVLDFSDMMILAMAFPNILGLILLSGKLRKELKDYQKRRKIKI